MLDKVRDGLRWVVTDRRKEKYIFTTFKSSEENIVNPLLNPRGAYLLQTHLRGGGGGLIDRDEGLN